VNCISAGGVAVVMTEFGEYIPTPFEVSAFRQVYGNEPVKAESYVGEYVERKWEVELYLYAAEQMRQQWEQGK
jgi:hypothetical protein